MGKTDIRSFSVKSTCNLPVSWAIDPMDFADSPNISISPSFGTLPPGGATTISITFYSKDALVVNGKFAVRYSDAEGGIDVPARSTLRLFNVIAECYAIKAVSLTAGGEEEKGDEVDYGVVRVGDYAHQTGIFKHAIDHFCRDLTFSQLKW